MIAIVWYFLHMKDLKTEYAILYGSVTVVSMFWGFYAGTLIDRFNRKMVFMGINVAGALVLTSVSILGLIRGDLDNAFVALVFASTVFIYNIHFPSVYAFMQEITERQHYQKITSYLEIQNQLTFAVSGAIGAVLLEGTADGYLKLFGFHIPTSLSFKAWPIHQIFVIDAITYVCAFLIISSISYKTLTPRTIDTSALINRMKEGMRYLRDHPSIFQFGLSSHFVFVCTLLYGFYLQAIYIDVHMQLKAGTYATSEMMFAIGSLCAGIFAGVALAKTSRIRGVITMFILTATVYLSLAISNSIAVLFLGSALLGFANAGIRILRVTVIFNNIPNSVIGRANSIFTIFRTLFMIIFMAGFLIYFHYDGSEDPHRHGRAFRLCALRSSHPCIEI